VEFLRRGDEASAAIAAQAMDRFWVKVSRLVENPLAAAEIPVTPALTGRVAGSQ